MQMAAVESISFCLEADTFLVYSVLLNAILILLFAKSDILNLMLTYSRDPNKRDVTVILPVPKNPSFTLI